MQEDLPNKAKKADIEEVVKNTAGSYVSRADAGNSRGHGGQEKKEGSETQTDIVNKETSKQDEESAELALGITNAKADFEKLAGQLDEKAEWKGVKVLVAAGKAAIAGIDKLHEKDPVVHSNHVKTYLRGLKNAIEGLEKAVNQEDGDEDVAEEKVSYETLFDVEEAISVAKNTFEKLILRKDIDESLEAVVQGKATLEEIDRYEEHDEVRVKNDKTRYLNKLQGYIQVVLSHVTDNGSFLEVEKDDVEKNEGMIEYEKPEVVENISTSPESNAYNIPTEALDELEEAEKSLNTNNLPRDSKQRVFNVPKEALEDSDALEKFGTKTELQKYQEARKEWRENTERKAYHEKNKEYKDALKAYYEDTSWKAKARNFGQGVGKFFGFNPKFPPELEKLKSEHRDLRSKYAEGLDKMLHERNRVRYEKGPANVGKKYEGLEDDAVKVAFSNKFIVKPQENLNMLQMNNGLTPEGREKVNSIMSKMSKYKWHSRVGRVLFAGALGAGTAGVGALLAGGYAAVRMTAGVLGGAAAGNYVYEKNQKGVDVAEKRVDLAKINAHIKFTLGNLNDLEQELLSSEFEKDKKVFQQKSRTIAAAVLAGGVAGGLTGWGAEATLGPDSTGSGAEVSDKTTGEPRRLILTAENVGYTTGDPLIEKTEEVLGHEGYHNDDLKEIQDSYGEDGSELSDKHIYSVVKGDTLSSIVRSEYQDILKDFTKDEQIKILDQLFEKARADEGLRSSIGLRSDDVDLVYPDEKLNISQLGEELKNTVAGKEPDTLLHIKSSPLEIKPDATDGSVIPISDNSERVVIHDAKEAVATLKAELATIKQEIENTRTPFDGHLKTSVEVSHLDTDTEKVLQEYVNMTAEDIVRGNPDISKADLEQLVRDKTEARFTNMSLWKPNVEILNLDLDVKLNESSVNVTENINNLDQNIEAPRVKLSMTTEGFVNTSLEREVINYATQVANEIVAREPDIDMRSLEINIYESLRIHYQDFRWWKDVDIKDLDIEIKGTSTQIHNESGGENNLSVDVSPKETESFTSTPDNIAKMEHEKLVREAIPVFGSERAFNLAVDNIVKSIETPTYGFFDNLFGGNISPYAFFQEASLKDIEEFSNNSPEYIKQYFADIEVANGDGIKYETYLALMDKLDEMKQHVAYTENTSLRDFVGHTALASAQQNINLAQGNA